MFYQSSLPLGEMLDGVAPHPASRQRVVRRAIVFPDLVIDLDQIGYQIGLD